MSKVRSPRSNGRSSWFEVRTARPRGRHIIPPPPLESAFSLVEVVVAIGIVGVGIVAVLGAVSGLSGGAAYTADSVAAAALAQSLMAEIDTRPYEGATPAPTGRIIDGLVAYYPLQDGSGTLASDESRFIPLAPLSLIGGEDVKWIPGSNGVSIEVGGGLENTYDAAKITDACIDSRSITVEIWIQPDSVECEECPLVSCSDADINFILAQGGGDLLFYIRTSGTDKKGNPPAATLTGLLTKEITHCAATFDGARARIFLNGMPVAQNDFAAGNLSVWQDYPLRAASHPKIDVRWAGKIFLVAIYSRALEIAEIQQNFAAGPSPSHLYNRLGYDDIDDYNGYADSPPYAEDGSVVAGAEQFGRTVQVVNVALDDLDTEKGWDSTDAKRITVQVFKNYKLLAKLVRARYRGVSADDAD